MRRTYHLPQFVLLLPIALLAACAGPEPEPGARPASQAPTNSTARPAGPYDPAAKMRPDLVVADPTSAAAGEAVELTWPEETLRGVAWTLEEQDGNSWQVRYFLTSRWESDEGSPSWWPVGEDEGRGWADIGVSGPGPDLVQIPDTAPAGQYRLCTANSSPNVCTPFEVLAQD